jgi:hypothetical protein
MNRITRERLKKQRAAKGFTGIKIKDLGKFFKRKEMQAPTPSGVKPKADAPKSSATKDTPKPAGQTNRSGGNRAGGAGSKKQGEQKTVTPKTTTTQDRVSGRKKNQSTGTVSKLNEEATKIQSQLKQTGLSGKIKNRLKAKLERIKARIASLGARGSR